MGEDSSRDGSEGVICGGDLGYESMGLFLFSGVSHEDPM